jgi:hypothetical protein
MPNSPGFFSTSIQEVMALFPCFLCAKYRHLYLQTVDTKPVWAGSRGRTLHGHNIFLVVTWVTKGVRSSSDHHEYPPKTREANLFLLEITRAIHFNTPPCCPGNDVAGGTTTIFFRPAPTRRGKVFGKKGIAECYPFCGKPPMGHPYR